MSEFNTENCPYKRRKDTPSGSSIACILRGTMGGKCIGEGNYCSVLKEHMDFRRELLK